MQVCILQYIWPIEQCMLNRALEDLASNNSIRMKAYSGLCMYTTIYVAYRKVFEDLANNSTHRNAYG